MQNQSRAWIGHLMVLSTILIYSFNTNFIKMLMPHWIGPEGLVLLRCTVSMVGFWLISLFIPRSSKPLPTLKEKGILLLGGALGMAGNLLVYLRGLSLTGPVDAFVIRTVQPIIVIAMSVLFLHAVFTRYKAVGIALGLAGTIYAALMPHEGIAHDSFGGDMLVFTSAIFNSLFLVLIKPYTVKFDAVTVMKWMSLSASIVALPFGIHQVFHAGIFTDAVPVTVWLQFAYIFIFATMIAYFLSVKALSYISPFVESAYIYLLPVTGSAVSILFGLQKFSWHDPIALALILSGFFFINKTSKAVRKTA